MACQGIQCYQLCKLYLLRVMSKIRMADRTGHNQVNTAGPIKKVVKRERPALPYSDNYDPSAGSPTETLLRLVLPLNDRVWRCSLKSLRANHKDSFAPTASPSHSIGSSDGRCVQRAGTYSSWVGDPRLQGIPCSRALSSARSPARYDLNGLPSPLGIGIAYWSHQCSARAAQDI